MGDPPLLQDLCSTGKNKIIFFSSNNPSVRWGFAVGLRWGCCGVAVGGGGAPHANPIPTKVFPYDITFSIQQSIFTACFFDTQFLLSKFVDQF